MNRPRWEMEEANEPAGADLLDIIASVNWPHVLLAALIGFLVGALTFWGLT